MFKKINLPTIPSCRHRNIVKFIDRTVHKLEIKKSPKFLNTKNLLKRRKLFYKVRTPCNNTDHFLGIHSAVTSFYCQFKPYRIYTKLINGGGVDMYSHHSLLVSPGTVFYNTNTTLIAPRISQFLGLTCPLKYIPYHLNIHCIKNFTNTKWTYSKSSGIVTQRNKSKKKNVKLITIRLASSQIKLFPKNCCAIIGTPINFRIKSLCEGKWGFGLHTTKTISVRGVAMNPVDHPNGGRTKSCQPEKTPWGWVAKRNK